MEKNIKIDLEFNHKDEVYLAVNKEMTGMVTGFKIKGELDKTLISGNDISYEVFWYDGQRTEHSAFEIILDKAPTKKGLSKIGGFFRKDEK